MLETIRSDPRASPGRSLKCVGGSRLPSIVAHRQEESFSRQRLPGKKEAPSLLNAFHPSLFLCFSDTPKGQHQQQQQQEETSVMNSSPLGNHTPSSSSGGDRGADDSFPAPLRERINQVIKRRDSVSWLHPEEDIAR